VIAFDRAAGWTRERAERWVEEHLRARPLGRTAVLHRPHRFRQGLALFLSDLLLNEAPPAAAVAEGGGPAVTFVAAPSGPAHPPGRRHGEGEGRGRRGGAAAVATRVRPPQGGAGLETDLADPRRLDPLPAEWRAVLPDRGLVNYYEARAAVRALEDLLADADFRAAAAAWPVGAGRAAVAVVALYPAQAELLERLARQSPALADAAALFAVGPPDAFRQRESLAAVVSLTRSHSHRAVPFGDGPHDLALALTRARDRLVVVGDAGTLARRGQWHGPLDHLDEAAAERERGVVARLTAYLHGQGTHPDLLLVRESGAA
jgi:hypothetical protein